MLHRLFSVFSPKNSNNAKMTNSIIEAMKTRRSVRKYKSEPVPQELVDQVIEAGTFAASGKGLQPWLVVQVDNPTTREELRKVNAQIMGASEDADPFYGAPVCLIVLGLRSNPNHNADATLMMGNMMLAAHSLGLGSCWINRAREEFEMPQWKEWLHSLGVADDYEGVAHLILGWPDGLARPAKERKHCVIKA